jgi:hypothetical protein
VFKYMVEKNGAEITDISIADLVQYLSRVKNK